MDLEGKSIGFAFTGSFCTFSKTILELKKIVNLKANVTPIMSFNSFYTDTKFGKAEDFRKQIEDITKKEIIHTITAAEPIGPKKLLDALVIAPCTGNTLAKLAHSIADSPVTMAAKSHLRNGRPILLAVSTNDALAGAAENIGKLLARRNYYFVPFGQDDPAKKPTSMVADFKMIPQALHSALEGKQIQPILL